MTDAFGLAALRVTDGFGERQDVLCPCGGEKEDAIVIAQYQILPQDRPFSYHCRLQRQRVAWVLPLRPGGDCAQTEDGQANGSQFSGIPMKPPNHQAAQPRGLGLLGNQVADSTLIQAPGVVHDQNVTGHRVLDHLKKDIDASRMPGGADPSRDSASREDGLQERWGAADGNSSP